MANRRFGTLEGVFTPCVLSLLGVIMYLRLGWVVGSIGLGGAFLIILLANLITIATGLSMSSVVTNIRIGAGGAYSIITKSLGIEAGGAIGFPLYISQSISIAFYITGFAECWLSVFPAHSFHIVCVAAWFVLLVVSYVSARLAFRIQFLILGLIVLSLVSIFMGTGKVEGPLRLWEGFSSAAFWPVFAVFFPAVTGILAGASMSGELQDPKKDIPLGTLTAIAVTCLFYLLLAYWFAKQVSLEELRTNTSIALDLGRWRFLIIGGIMGATLSSALAMFVAAPRVLLALGKHAVLPFSSYFGHVNKKEEPTRAILFSALIVLATLFLGSLDKIASLLTMFFLITYGMINLTVFIEQTIGIVSFRPTFRVPRIISLLGAVGCLAVMFLIDVTFSIIAIIVIVILYVLLLRRGVHFYSPDIRSGMLVYLAENFSKMAAALPYYPKIWKPNVLMPVLNFQNLPQTIPFIRAMIYPSGRLTMFEVIDRKWIDSQKQQHGSQDKQNKKTWITHRVEMLEASVRALKEENLFVEVTAAEADDNINGSITVMQALKGKFFTPNTMFLILDNTSERDNEICRLIQKAEYEGLGVVLLCLNETLGLCQEKVVNLWIRRQSPNMDMSILIALQLKNNWEGQLRIVQVVEHDFEVNEALFYLNKLKDLMRLPLDVEFDVKVGSFQEALHTAESADINVFGMPEEPDMKMIRYVAHHVKTSVLFLRDSDNESALA